MCERDELVARLTDPSSEFRWADRQRAADQIERDGREVERLREALQRIEAASKFWSEYPDGNDAIRYAHDSTRRIARAALNGEGG